MGPQPTYEELMSGPGIASLPDQDAADRIGHLVDASDDVLAEDGIARALEWCDELEKRPLPDNLVMTVAYFRSNAWAARFKRDVANRPESWHWEQPIKAQQIFWLRRVMANPAFQQWHEVRRCQTITNLGTCFSNVGRFVEAIELYTRAISIIPHFWEAIGNRGATYFTYGRSDYDMGHSCALFIAAHDDLKLSVKMGEIDGSNPGGLGFFRALLDQLNAGVNIEAERKAITLDGYSLGRSIAEKYYRSWCLQNSLFLNTLNDIGYHDVAAIDGLSLPDFATKIKEPPSVLGFFNQLKQEFVSARLLYFEGIQQDATPHFSDREVKLVNTLDYPAYGLRVEKTKIAFRMAYSLLDKIAYFLFYYMKLPMEARQVSFRSIWRESSKKNAPIRGQFEKSENLAFRGLYWLSKDIFDEEFQETTEPDARELNEIRNHLEHKYLKAHTETLGVFLTKEGAHRRTDDLAYSVHEQDLASKTLRLLKLTRAALIYLSLGMHREEDRRRAANKDAYRAPMHLDEWKDEWKR